MQPHKLIPIYVTASPKQHVLSHHTVKWVQELQKITNLLY